MRLNVQQHLVEAFLMVSDGVNSGGQIQFSIGDCSLAENRQLGFSNLANLAEKRTELRSVNNQVIWLQDQSQQGVRW